MASPETNRTGGPRPPGAGVKGRIAMFEKSTSSAPGSPAPGNGTASNPTSRDKSPAPRPLAKVRTSFVTVTANGGGMIGLQKVPISPSVTSPITPLPEGQKLSGEALEALGKEQAVIDKKDETAESINRMKMPDESTVKKDLGSANEHSTLLKGGAVTPAGLLPTFGEISTKKEEETTTEKPLEPIPTPKEEEEGEKEEQAKPANDELKPKPVVAKVAPRSPTKPTYSPSKTAKLAAANKPGKILSLPLSKSNTNSPLPSPAFPPKSPVRSAAPASSSASRTKPTPATSLASPPTRTRTGVPASTTAVTSTSAPPKSRPATAAAKTKAQKPEITKPAREPTKPPTIRSSAFAPTAASAAKLTADQKAATARSRPPSSASVRNRSPPDGSVAMRRGNSGTGSSRPGRKEQRSPQRPQTSTAVRNTNRSSVGSLASVAPGAGGDFLSRMMRPTTASAGKVLDKKPPVGAPSGRSASVASTSRRREPSLPPTARLQKQRTDEKKVEAATTEKVVPEVQEPITEVAQESKVEETPKESVQVVAEQTPIVGVPVAKENEDETNEEDYGGQSPSTTTSSTTLVHEDEGKDDGEESTHLAKE